MRIPNICYNLKSISNVRDSNYGKRSRIINTTSITGYQGHEMLVDHSSTKGAITSFTRALSQQLASKNILVNGVAPGPIWTPFIPATMYGIEDFGESTPLLLI